MAINNFIPEIWDANLLKALRNQLVYAQAGIVNRDYEGDIARAGDTVHITSIGDPGVRTYARNAGATDTTNGNSAVAGITYDLLNDATEAFQVAQSDYFAFQVDDIDRRQALPGFVEEASVGAAYKLSAKLDSYVAGKMAAGVVAGNQLGSVNVGVRSGFEAGTASAVLSPYDMLVQFRTLLNRSNTPSTGRFVVVPPEMYALLLKDDRFIRADASGTTEGLRNGVAGRAAGFDILESNVVPEASGVFTVLGGHSIATTVAQQILETEALRLQTGFSDAVRGLHVYDAKVLDGRKSNLVSAAATVYAGAVSDTATTG